jgi:hypothetical protein
MHDLVRFLTAAFAIGFFAGAGFTSTSKSRNEDMIKGIQFIPDAGSSCSPDSWRPPNDTRETGVQALLKNIALGTKWADLPAQTKTQLQKFADNRLAAYRSRWGAAALSKKESLLIGCPTDDVSAAIDYFYQRTYDSILPETFSLKNVKNSDFRNTLVRNYIGTIAASRSFVRYPVGKLPNRDWDGKSFFDSVSLPDQRTYNDIRAYNARIVQTLNAVDSMTLNGLERALKEHVLFDTRAKAAGGGNFGDGDMESACHIIQSDWSVLAGYQLDKKEHHKERPEIFSNDDEVLQEVNALYTSNMHIKWLDVGTLNSALNFCDFTGMRNMIASLVGNPTTNEIAKGMVLLKNWWVERVHLNSDAQNKCTVYSAADRERIWEAFSASQQFNNDGAYPMEAYRLDLDAQIEKNRIHYREIAKLALKRVFPDNLILTDHQRETVIRAIEIEDAFGMFPEKLRLAIDAAQDTIDGPAAVQWKNAIATYVTRIGGKYGPGETVRPNEEQLLQSMFEEVKMWVAAQYQRYPIDIASLYPHITLAIDTEVSSPDTVYPGVITIGIATERSKIEYYSWLLHELRHAVVFAWQATAPDKSQVKHDEGPNVEGSGVAVEALLLEPFAKAALKDDTAYALYLLDYGIRDARFSGTTDAALQKYFRSGCSGSLDMDTINFTKNIAVGYGLTESKADTVALRAHAGSQYLQYILPSMQVLEAISYLQNQIDPGKKHRIDPFMLFACGLNNPSRDESYVNTLRVCMKL